MSAWPGARRLLRPWWVASHLTIVALLVATVNLGLWQLRRLDQRQAHNALVEARADLKPLAFEPGVRSSFDDLEFRAALVTGTFDPTRQVYVVNRSSDGLPGVHVVTLLATDSGDLAVNRGFVPRRLYLEGVADTWAPPVGEVEVEGLLRASGTSRGGHGDEVERVDAADLSARWDTLLPPVHLDAEPLGDVPYALPAPDLGEGPHLSYAVQWFVFTTIGLVGYPLVLVRLARREPEADMPVTNDPDLRAVHGLRVRGFADTPELADALGLDGTDLAARLGALEEAGYVRRRDGRMAGWMLTPEGRTHGEALVAAELDAAGARSAVDGLYRRFLEVNQGFLALCTDWQLRTVDDEQVVNDHADPDHDAAVIARLGEADAVVQPVCAELAGLLERFDGYGPEPARSSGSPSR